LILLSSMTLLAGRSSELHARGQLDRPLSRETAFLFNNLLFTAFTFTVLLGTLFPLVAEAIRGVKVSVGGPFFNRMTIPICAALLFLMGVGPVLPWRGSSWDQFKRELVVPLLAMVVSIALAFTLGARNIYGLVAFGCAGFALTCNIGEFVRGARARMRAHGESSITALGRLIRANNRRYGGYIAHIGVVLVAVGITASSIFSSDREATLTARQSLELGDYSVRFDELNALEEPHRFVIEALVTVQKNGRSLGQMNPRLNFYQNRDEPVPTPAVRTRALNDLYISMLAFERDGSNITLHVMLKPLVGWIWLGGLVVALGALVGALPLQARRAAVVPQAKKEPIAA
jgi:cytochrome c-type biogenesis protein CcmF